MPLHRPTRRPKPACSTAPGGPQENQGSGAVTPRNSSIPRPGIALPCQDATTAPAGLDELCRAAHILSELGVPVGPHALAGPVWPIIFPRRSADPPCPLADADTNRLVDRVFAQVPNPIRLTRMPAFLSLRFESLRLLHQLTGPARSADWILQATAPWCPGATNLAARNTLVRGSGPGPGSRVVGHAAARQLPSGAGWMPTQEPPRQFRPDRIRREGVVDAWD